MFYSNKAPRFFFLLLLFKSTYESKFKAECDFTVICSDG